MQTDYSYINRLIKEFQPLALENGHRLPVAIYTQPSCIEHLRHQLINLNPVKTLDLTIDNHLKANDIIGQEYDFILFHLTASFDPNLFAAISGTLRKGGIFLVFITEEQSGRYFFSHYLINKISINPHFLSIHTNINLEFSKPLQVVQTAGNIDVFEPQRCVVEKIKALICGKNNAPIAITADRGRGKSAAIGIAIGQLMLKRKINVLITAPSLAASAIIFKHIQQTLPKATNKKGKICFQQSSAQFIAPDKLLQNLPTTDLLVVDEAAGHNMFSLRTLMQNYPKIVFATTLHGYEGSGQSFANRFNKLLKGINPKFDPIKLEQPIRWNKDDPLEAFIDHTFLLSSEPPTTYFPGRDAINDIHVSLIDTKDLRSNDTLLKSVFLLLKSAHYKTSPNDLRQLLESENALVFTVYYQASLIAAALTEKESLKGSTLIDEIYKGRRRPKGNILPQSLVVHLGLKKAAEFDYIRIMRIAVHPDHQNQGVGSALLSFIIGHADKTNIDFIGASFGATPQLLNFWNQFDFHCLRIGYKKNSFSANNAALITKPLNKAAQQLQQEANIIFINNFISQLSASHSALNPHIVQMVFCNLPNSEKKLDLTEKIKKDVISFAKYNRSYDDNMSSLKTFLISIIKNSNSFKQLTSEQAQLLILKVLQNRSTEEIASQLGMSGKKQIMNRLKTCFMILISTVQDQSESV